jgi:ATP-grasp ribosomal peptide maturase
VTGSRGSTVLLISYDSDATADLVVDALVQNARARVVRFDLADFPAMMEIDVTGPPWSGHVDTPGGRVALSEVAGVLYRRPTQYGFPAAMTAMNRRFAAGEARVGLGGLLAGLPARWVNHPARVADAEFKPIQLQVAHQLGIPTPRTLITSSPRAARAFAASLGRPVIYKTLHGLPVERNGQELVTYTSVVTATDLDDAAIRLTAHLFQELLPKRRDLRVTMIGDACFAVAIDARSDSARIDYRADYAAVAYEHVDLDARLRGQLRAYLDHFGLAFGAFDLVETETAERVFLECNPNGQWGWIQDETALPIAEAMADYLCAGVCRER